jgi:phosphotransferase system  glucose/maltose/N-acetylglucosamine-specific IIC component
MEATKVFSGSFDPLVIAISTIIVSILSSIIWELVALAIGHGEQVVRQVSGLGRERCAHGLCPVVDRRCPSIGSIGSQSSS